MPFSERLRLLTLELSLLLSSPQLHSYWTFPKDKKAGCLAGFIINYQLVIYFHFLTVPSWILPLYNKRSQKTSEDTSDMIKLCSWIPLLLKTHSRAWHYIYGKLIDTNLYLIWHVIIYLFLILKLFSLDSVNSVRYKKLTWYFLCNFKG